jgi:hypothetical protein
MSDNHTHDNCVECLQKEVRRLNAALDEAKRLAEDQEREAEEAKGKAERAWGALKKIGVISINLDTGRPTFGVSPCCDAHYEINQDATRNCSKCANCVP